MRTLTAEDATELYEAKELLTRPSLVAKVGAAIGLPFERGAALLPERVRTSLAELTSQAVRRALAVALSSLDASPAPRPRNRLHKVAGALSGAIGGTFGLPALALELPVSTVLILRSIADIAQSFGEDLADAEARLACVEVFALGGFSKSDDAAEAGYYATRAALASAVSDALQHVARRGLAAEGGPAIIRLVSSVAARFGVVVSDKAALGAVPVLGALGGALVNAAFMDHFQAVARGHFTLRRLERRYDVATVRDAYERLEL